MQDSPSPLTTAPDVAATTAPSNRSALLIVFLVVFIDLLGFGIVLPLLPRIADTYVAAIIPGGKDNFLGGTVVGLLMASFSLMQFLGSPIWGRVSDRIGRRPVLLLGLAGSVVFYALLGFACSPALADGPVELILALLFVSRIGAGLAGATIATAQAAIADCTPPDKRKHGMALIGAAFGIGFTFGPLMGALAMALFPNHFEAVGYSAAILSCVALGLGIRLLPETRQFDQAPPLDRRWINWSAAQTALANPALGPVILAFFLATLGFAAFESTLALFLKDTLGYRADQSYYAFAYVGLVLMLTQGVLYRRLAKRVTEPTFMVLGIGFMAAGLGGLALVTWTATDDSLGLEARLVLVFVAMASAVVGFAFLTPSAQALISRRTDASQQGEILGVNQSASALARILGPVIGLTLYKLMTPPLLPFAFGALVLLMLLPMMPRIRRG